MAQVEILSEQESPGGWEFSAQILDAEGALRSCRVTLSWADYNLWSPDGSDAPQRVAEAVVHFLADQVGADAVPGSFDASIVRRRFPNADASIARLMRGS